MPRSANRKSREAQFALLPLREQLEGLSSYYHRLQNERERARPVGALRRRLEDKLVRIAERFERLVEEWVPEPALRRAWRNYLHHHGSRPSGPPAIPRLVFRGRSTAGSLVEVRGKEGELAVEVDGCLVERIARAGEFASRAPVVRFVLEGVEIRETFDSTPAAFRALARFVAEEASPPWEHAAELLTDGLIDVHFDLTPRGRRALLQREKGD